MVPRETPPHLLQFVCWNQNAISHRFRRTQQRYRRMDRHNWCSNSRPDAARYTLASVAKGLYGHQSADYYSHRFETTCLVTNTRCQQEARPLIERCCVVRLFDKPSTVLQRWHTFYKRAVGDFALTDCRCLMPVRLSFCYLIRLH